jgi:hypothetical protein
MSLLLLLTTPEGEPLPLEEGLRAFLKADSAITALVGSRIDWNVRPQASGLPAVVLHRITGRRDYTMGGRSGLVDSVVQIDCWGSTYAAAKAVSRAVVLRLDELRLPPYQAFVEDERDTFDQAPAPGADGSTEFHRASLDVRVWHSEALAA